MDESTDHPKCPRLERYNCNLCLNRVLQQRCCLVRNCLRREVRTVARAKELLRSYREIRSIAGRELFFIQAARYGRHVDHAYAKKELLLPFPFPVQHLHLCVRAAAFLFGTSLSTIWRAVHRVAAGRIEPRPRTERRVLPSQPHCQLVAWLQNFFDIHGDKSPTKEGVLLMPRHLTVSSMYGQFKREMSEKGIRAILSCATMERVIRTQFQHVRFPQHSPLGVCNECDQLLANLHRPGLTDAERTQLKRLREDHLRDQATERQLYAVRQQEATAKNPLVLSCAIDGASAVPFPCTWPPSKQEATNNMLLPLYGLKWHNWNRPVIAFSPPVFTHNANYVITFLSWQLARIFQQAKAHPEVFGDNFNPRTLYIQCDNTTRENKNRFFFLFLALLIHNHYFDTIELNMLPVGHTHIDVDAIFGMLRNGRKKVENHIYSLPEYMASISDPKKRPNGVLVAQEDVLVLGGVWDFASLLDNEVIENITQYRCYRFQRLGNSVHLNYREDSLPTTSWRHSFTVGAANCAPVILQQPPPSKTVPTVQLPKQESEEWWNKLASLPQSLGDKITRADLQWWRTWTRRAPCSLEEIPSGAYTMPPKECLLFFRHSTFTRAPVIPSSLPVPKSAPPPPLKMLPRKTKTPLESLAQPQSSRVEDPEREIELFHDPKRHEFKLNDIVLLFNGGSRDEEWLAKITTDLGRTASGGPNRFRVSWFDKQKNGSWKLRDVESRETNTWPANVQLCRLELDQNMRIPIRLQHLIDFVLDRDGK